MATTKKTSKKQAITVDEMEYMAWIAEQNAKIEAWKKASDEGTLNDDFNPVFMFSTMPTKLLSMIVKGEINPTFLAGHQLAQRGQDKDGNWVGFDQAAKIHNVK